MDIIRDYLESFVNGPEKLKENYITELLNSPPGSLINNKLLIKE